MVTPSYYDVLGVTVAASDAEIRHAYLTQARRLHPDVTAGGDDSAMQRLNEAWAVLRDPVRRRAYDVEHGRRPWEPEAPEPPSPEPDEYVAADLPEDELRASRRSDVVMLVPAALVVVFAGCLFVGMMLASPALLALGSAALLLAGVGFVILPFVTMARARSRDC